MPRCFLLPTIQDNHSIKTNMEKLYYTIGEAAELLGENTSLVRFWSEKFSEFIKPARNKKSNRLFTSDDIEKLKIIHYLVKEKGMTLEGAAKRMKDNKTGEDRSVEVINKLSAIKVKLQEISKNL